MARSRAALALLLGLSATAVSAQAQDASWTGTWRASPMRVRIEVQSWGPNCNRRPPATSTEPGGTVQITEQGDHLRLSGAVQARTDGCWTPNHAVERISTRATDDSWRTVCRTPESDARSESGTYSLRAKGPNELVFEERSEYDWQLSGSRCHAIRTARRTFERVGAQKPEPEPDPEPDEPSCDPGPPAKLQLRPREAQVQPGEKVCIGARVLDRAGCPVRGASVRWKLEHPAAIHGTLRGGCFLAADNAAEAEGEFRVVATAGELEAAAKVTVRTADLSDLIARRTPGGEDGGVVEVVDPQAEEATRVAARTEPGGSASWGWPLFGALGAALLLLLVGGVVLLRRRGKTTAARRAARDDRPREREEDEPSAPSPSPLAGATVAEDAPPPGASATPPGPPVLACSVCGREFEGETMYCPEDGAQLVDPRESRARGQGMICPACRRGYPPDARYCPHDSEELMPYAMFAARQKSAEASSQGKICPECGGRYEAHVRFCGKDGAELVLVN